MFGCSGTRPAGLGIHDGALRPCPGTPNCVSSEARTPEAFRVEPLPAPGGVSDMRRVAALVTAFPRAEVITVRPDYVHAEFTSLLWRFKDDVEFRFDSAAGVIHVRSASRLGRSDLGVNRKRVEALRKQWDASRGTEAPR